jgi:hypothetical protein
MRDRTKPFTGDDMTSATGGNQVGLLEALGYLAAIVVIVGSAVGGWNFNLLIALIMVIIPYAIFRDVRALNRLTSLNEHVESSRTNILFRKSSPRGGRSQQPTPLISGQQGVARKTQAFAGWVYAQQHTMQKGTTHEPIG